MTGSRSSYLTIVHFFPGLFFIAILLLLPTTAFSQQMPEDAVNSVLRDISWIALHGESPNMDVDEVTRLQTHILYVIDQLENADLSHLSRGQRTRRQNALNGLRGYAALGQFPQRRTDDGFGTRRPRFIDDRGVHCAVGEMIRQSGEASLAAQINANWEYALIAKIEAPRLEAWAKHYGFDALELAMIQPGYHFPFRTSQSLIEGNLRNYHQAAIFHCAPQTNAAQDEMVDLVVERIRGEESQPLIERVRPTDEDSEYQRCLVDFIEPTIIWQRDGSNPNAETEFFSNVQRLASVEMILETLAHNVATRASFSCVDPGLFRETHYGYELPSGRIHIELTSQGIDVQILEIPDLQGDEIDQECIKQAARARIRGGGDPNQEFANFDTLLSQGPPERVISASGAMGLSYSHHGYWESIESVGRVAMSRQQLLPSEDYSYRGEVTADAHISRIMAVLLDPDALEHWIDRYHSHETIDSEEWGTSSEINQMSNFFRVRLSFPFGFSDRDFLLRQDLKADSSQNIVAFQRIV